MTSMQVDLFMEISRNLSFSKTAATFHTTQPTVSRQIRLLEEEWGFRLFDRGGREVSITPSGKVMADFFNERTGSLGEALEQAKKND